MGDKRSALLLPIAMIVGFIAIAVRGPEATQRSGAIAPAAPVSAEGPEGRAVEPLLDVLRQAVGANDSSCASLAERLERFDVRPLIVLVPDPIETRLDFDYDREIEAVREAAADAGFLPDRFYLPWRRAAAGATVVKIGNESDANGALTTQPETPLLHRSRPGLLVFRQDGGEPRSKLLLVLAVGESPVTGPHPDALAAALDLAMRPISNCGIDPDPKPPWRPANQLFIVGPRFSGSATALGRIVSDTADRLQYKGSIHFRSGTATVPSVPRALAAGPPSLRPRDFRSMLPPDDVVLPRIMQYLHAHREVPRFADDTAQARHGQDRRWSPETSPAPAPVVTPSETIANSGPDIAVLYEATTAYGEASTDDNLRAHHPIYVPYSSNIAAYRSLSDRSGLLASLADSLPQAYSRSRPALSMDGHDRANDLPRALSVEVANLAGLSIEASIAELRRIGTRHVLLLGTSSLDLVFLANLVRGGLPNAQLAAVNADLIFAHPQFAEYLTGTLLFSAYPPVAAASVLGTQNSENRLRLFSSDMAAGVHDAVVASLLEAEARRSGKVNYDAAREQLVRSTLSGPTYVWVSMVGRGALWGVDKIRIPDRCPSRFTWSVEDLVEAATIARGGRIGDVQLPPEPRFPRPGLPVGFIVTTTLIALNAMALSYLCFGGRLPLDAGGWLRSAAAGSDAATCAVLIILSLSFTTLGLSIATDALYSTWSDAEWLHRIARVFWYLSAGSLAGSFLVMLFRILDAGPSNDLGAIRRALVGICSLCAVLVVAVVALGELLPDVLPSATSDIVQLDRWLRFARLATLSSGVTPLVPAYLLASAFTVGLYSFIRRWKAMMRVRDGKRLVAADRSLGPLFQDLLKRLGDPWSGARAWYARSWTIIWSCGAAAFVSILLIIPRHVPSAEGALFDLPFVLALTIALAWAFQSGLRFLDCWTQLSRILTSLSWDWLVQAFRRLPEKVGEGLDLAIPFSDSRECLRRSLQQLSMMQGQCAASSPADRDFRVLAPSRHPDAIHLTQDTQRRISVASDALLHETDRELFAIGGAVLRQLRKRWQDEPSPDLRSLDDQFEWAKVESGDTLRQYVRSLDRDKRALRLAEDFVAAQFARLIGATFDQLKLLAIQAAALTVLVLLAIASYPIQPQRILMTIAIVLTAFVVVTVTIAIVQQDRNEILSYLRNRNPNRIDLDSSFFTQIFSYGVVPTLTVLATAFPSLGSEIAKVLSWVGL